MGKFTRSILAVLAFLMGSTSYAAPGGATPVTQYRTGLAAANNDYWVSSVTAACGRRLYWNNLSCGTPFVSNRILSSVQNGTSNSCYEQAAPCAGGSPGGYYIADSASQRLWCPNTDTPPDSDGLCPIFNPDACGSPTGTVIKQNVTLGWARSGVPDAIDHVGKLYSPYEGGIPAICLNKCSAKPTKTIKAYRSVEPSPNGLHRISADFEYTVQGTTGNPGETCTQATNQQATTDALSPNTPPMACAGVVGDVNGKKVCAPDGSTNNIPSPQGEPAPGTEDRGNPRAGDVPTTGEGSGTGGSGRTPSAGNGTATGGPASAAGSGPSSGNTTAPPTGEEQAACGAPGQPPCRIDETGTPSSKDYNAETSALETAKNDILTEIGKTRTGSGFTWTFALPTGCTPLVINAFSSEINGGLSIDICEWQPMIHDLMSMLWIAATIFALWGMASRAFAPE